jgi:predicted lysophospholipase L1 biosynthesis ABC-type transport system permease subunit
MVRYYFRDGSPLGKHVLFDGDDKPYEIVGVVGDSKYMEPGEITPRTIYFNAFQEGRLFSQLALRTTSAPEAVAPEVRQTVHEMLKTIPVDHITTRADQGDAAIVPERLIVTLSGLFGALGSGLAAVGIYGLLAYTVARRVNEIGIRMALGATRTGVTAMVLGDALGTIGSGLAIGVPLAFWVKRIAGSVVPDLPAQGIAPIALGAATMIGLGLVAALLPARRAAAIDPLDALRYD